jgi:hypothetical protein
MRDLVHEVPRDGPDEQQYTPRCGTARHDRDDRARGGLRPRRRPGNRCGTHPQGIRVRRHRQGTPNTARSAFRRDSDAAGRPRSLASSVSTGSARPAGEKCKLSGGSVRVPGVPPPQSCRRSPVPSR